MRHRSDMLEPLSCPSYGIGANKATESYDNVKRAMKMSKKLQKCQKATKISKSYENVKKATGFY